MCGRLLVVCHTERRDAVRIISARRATPHERNRHEE
ncbi:MAG: BrnT family toxin [Deltaproteobacteria bacterium]|nr:MAG: BrnT family toxin [Deltaproteobacteria bacterium]